MPPPADPQEEERTELLRRRDALAPGLLEKRSDYLMMTLQAQLLDRAMANAALRQVLKGVVVNYDGGALEIAWQHGGWSSLVYAAPPRAVCCS